MLLQEITSFIEKHSLIADHSTIVVGLSGGPDSVFLLHALHEVQKKMPIKLIAAHLDHEWRSNSADDLAFCQKTAEELGVAFVSAKASDLNTTIQYNGSQEEVGRKLRRHFLETVRQTYNADAIALGHHAQDQQETFFLRLMRGTTLSGLTGMKFKAGFYIRPLLTLNKTDILAYLHEKCIPYMLDPTNESDAYLRNRIRMKVLPALQACDARFTNNFERTIKSLQETEDFLTRITTQTFTAITTVEDGSYLLDINAFFNLDPVLQNRVLMQWLIAEHVSYVPTETFLHEIKRFLSNKKHNEHNMHHEWSLFKDHGKAKIIKLLSHTFETKELPLM